MTSDNQTTKEPPEPKHYREPWKVAGQYLFGYWLPFFGFRHAFPPAEITIHFGIRGPSPALMFQWFGRGFQMFFKNSFKKNGENRDG